MNTYKIIYTESLCHAFYVDAESDDEARERFARQSENGELDFSDGEVCDSGVKNIFEVREETKEDGNNHCNNSTRTFRQYQKWKEII